MCGIAGTINCSLTKSDIDLISHRGPDAQDLVSLNLGSNEVILGHTRLSILELTEAGSQPMFSVCGNYCIVFNGEIYNHEELRTKLRNINFRGHSDTETILYYLREFGIDAIKDLNGIFAFAFIDLKLQKLYLAKDFFGIKPLYYYRDGNKLIFGSEIKIIKNNHLYKKDIDTNSLNSFLTFRYNPAPHTLFKGIKKLEAATYLEYSVDGKITFSKYWKKVQKINHSISEKEAIIEYQRLLTQAVKRQLLSDVPVGLLLSGGLDSAVLAHLMSKESTYKIKTFTVGFNGKGRFNELEDARETSKLINGEHHETYMNRSQYMDYFDKSFYYTEEPIAEPTIPALFYVSKLASKSVKVVLSGQGADEPMAGYKRYQGEKIMSDYRKLLSILPLPIVQKIFPTNSTLERGIYSSKFTNELERFVAIYTLFTPEMKASLLSDQMLPILQDNLVDLFAPIYDMTESSADSLSKLLFLDTRTLLPDNLLLFNDKMTMANSIENRVPYLDIDLINFIESLPINLKLRGTVGKYIHRQATKDWLPYSIINRKKRAFETPVGHWFQEELGDSLAQLIDSANSFSRNHFSTKYIKEMIYLHKSRKKDYKKHLFIILSLELWYKNFYLNDSDKKGKDLFHYSKDNMQKQ